VDNGGLSDYYKKVKNTCRGDQANGWGMEVGAQSVREAAESETAVVVNKKRGGGD